MVSLQAITKPDFTEKSWRRSPNYLFTANDAVCPLIVQEMPKAIMGMPIAFLCVDEKYSVVALLGLEPETNYFVGKDGGWRGNYIPALYRAYPFVLAKNEPEEEKLLSMQRISELAQFAQAKSKAESTPPSKELNLDGVNMDGNISFENL